MAEVPHRTVAGRVQAEPDRTKGSRFVAHLAPATSPEQAAAFIEQVRAAAPDATHHCWGWRLADGRERAGDDGEPRDTAGAPILRHLAGADLVDVVAVVSRWFGGTKLGRGGLVRAYGDATAAAIAVADVEVHVPTQRFVVRHGYDLTGTVDGVLVEHHAEVVEEQYGEDVTRTVVVRAEVADGFRGDLVEATAARVEVTP